MSRLRSSSMSIDAIVAARDARTRRIGAIAWPSFFAAGVATMWFFAVVDPIELAAISWPHAEVSRELGYTIGFFMFWACTASASLFTAMLLGPPARDVQARTQ